MNAFNYFIYLFFLFGFSFITLTIGEWNADVKLINAHCENLTVEAKCPKLTKRRVIEFQLFAQRSDKNVSMAHITKYCKPDNTATILATFQITCKYLYFVNVTLQPEFIHPCLYCNDEFQSSIWFLGNETCDEDPNHCSHNKYEEEKNLCPSSQKFCSSLKSPVVNITEPLKEWLPNLTIINAFCNNITVGAICPRTSNQRRISFTLLHFKKGNYIPMISINRHCMIDNTNVQVTFELSCKQLYQINVSLSPLVNPFHCDHLCSVIHNSPIWLLGSENCNGEDFDDCNKLQQYRASINNCSTLFSKCKKTFSNGLIVLIVFLIILLLGLILTAFLIFKHFSKLPFQYQRADDKVLVYDPMDLVDIR